MRLRENIWIITVLFSLVSFHGIHSQNRTQELTCPLIGKGIYETGEDLRFNSYVF